MNINTTYIYLKIDISEFFKYFIQNYHRFVRYKGLKIVIKVYLLSKIVSSNAFYLSIVKVCRRVRHLCILLDFFGFVLLFLFLLLCLINVQNFHLKKTRYLFFLNYPNSIGNQSLIIGITKGMKIVYIS